jgi:hypothetical protein
VEKLKHSWDGAQSVEFLLLCRTGSNNETNHKRFGRHTAETTGNKVDKSYVLFTWSAVNIEQHHHEVIVEDLIG